jgi:hypothetical protein
MEKRSLRLKIDLILSELKSERLENQPKNICVHLCCRFVGKAKQRRRNVCTFSTSLFRLFANRYLSFFDIEFPVHRITVIRLLVYVFVSDLIAHARLFSPPLPRKCFSIQLLLIAMRFWELVKCVLFLMLAKSLEECKADKLVICPSQVVGRWGIVAVILMCNCCLG